MEGWPLHAVIVILMVIAGYAVVARGLLKASEPLRSRALELYGKMIRSGHCTEELRTRLDWHLDSIYSSLAAWRGLFVLICAVVYLTFRLVTFQGLPNMDWIGIPGPLKADYDRFTKYWMGAVLANSPMAAFLSASIAVIAASYIGPMNAVTKILSSHDGHHSHRHAA
jgi:hypothetical protein